jgi:hypothetical protein
MKKLFTIGVTAFALAITSIASAAYGEQPGFVVASAATVCSGHGAFGAFGEHGDVAHDFGINNLGSNGAPGANGYQTGLNNSGLCGNR